MYFPKSIHSEIVRNACDDVCHRLVRITSTLSSFRHTMFAFQMHGRPVSHTMWFWSIGNVFEGVAMRYQLIQLFVALTVLATACPGNACTAQNQPEDQALPTTGDVPEKFSQIDQKIVSCRTSTTFTTESSIAPTVTLLRCITAQRS